VGLAESAALRQALEGQGCKYWPFTVGDPRLLKNPSLAQEVLKVGSLPCVIVQAADGGVRLEARLSSGSTEEILGLVAKVRGPS
jgi:hypothetical protein